MLDQSQHPAVPDDALSACRALGKFGDGRCMLRCMNRTNVYLTEEQTQFLDARAARAGTTRSAVLRSIIDEAASMPTGLDEDVRQAFASLAANYPEVSERLFAADPQLAIDPVPTDA